MAYIKKKLSALQYSLDTFHRSNQDTSLVHKPTVFEGDWVQPGDLLADCSASEGGELALGHNILVAYMPWEGYNFEDAILISERLVYDDVFTSIHIERYETETRQTKLGSEKITRELPEVTPDEVKHLDSSGIAKIGSWVEEGDILVGKITPLPVTVQSPSQKFLYKLLDKKFRAIRDSSLRAPKSIKSKVIKIEVFSSVPMDVPHRGNLNPKAIAKEVYPFSNSSKKKEAKKKTLPSVGVALPFATVGKQGRSATLNSLPYSAVASKAKNQNKKKNFTDRHSLVPGYANTRPPIKLSTKVCYLSTKIHQQLYLKRMSLFMYKRFVPGFATVGFPAATLLDKPGCLPLPHRGKVATEGSSILHTGPEVNSARSTKLVHKLFDRVRNYYTDNKPPLKQNPKQITVHSIKLPYGTKGSGLAPKKDKISVGFRLTFTPRGLGLGSPKSQRRNNVLRPNSFPNSFSFSKHSVMGSLLVRNPQENAHALKEKSALPLKVQIYLAEKRKIQVGDKMAGRHGNKGIISQILPRQDMPYLPDGTAVDIVLNPLGVPSRMNVGQIYECLLGLAGKYLGQHFKIFPFDEIYGPEASRSFVYSKLYEAQQKTGLKWLFNPNTPGKLRLFDGRTGDSFEQPITVGRAYMLKLVHMVDDKIHARSTGPYSLVTQQPLRGRSKQGGQRMGEMEVWAIEGYGAAFTLLEMLTIKSDDMTGRMTLWHNLIFNHEISIGTPESFKVLISELQALCLDIGLFKKQDCYRT